MINLTDKIGSFVGKQLPEFIQLNNATFVSFIEAYYDWLETQNEELRNLLALKNVNDIDTTFDKFVDSFKNQFLLDFPSNLAINQKTNKPVDDKTLIKNIKAFYQAKGTEKSYEFLFRILYDTSVEFYYPKIDLLRASDGKWILLKSIRTTDILGNSIFDSLGKTVFQQNSSGTVTASAKVSNINRFQIGVFKVTEIFLDFINGTFISNIPIYFTDSNNTLQTESKLYSVISSITISNGGSGYKIGDKLVFTNSGSDTGQGGKAKVSKVSSTGKILSIKIENFGINYISAPAITVISEKGSGFSGSVVVGAVCNYTGYYANNDGKPSSTKVLQDNHYYQNYSYVLKSEIVIDTYKDAIKRLVHPAGLGFFGQILIKRTAKNKPSDFLNILKSEMPRIAHYRPYTFQTYDNLAQWFGRSKWYDSTVHDVQINSATSKGNPISAGITCGKPINGITGSTQYPNANPFWLIYTHPNNCIKDVISTRIYKDQLLDFAGHSNQNYSDSWKEWSITGGYSRSDWVNSFTGDYGYANLNILPNITAFRKIPVGAFLNIPLGTEIDTRFDDGIARTVTGTSLVP